MEYLRRAAEARDEAARQRRRELSADHEEENRVEAYQWMRGVHGVARLATDARVLRLLASKLGATASVRSSREKGR